MNIANRRKTGKFRIKAVNRLFSTILTTLALAVPAGTLSATPFVEANISSRFVIRGEQAVLDLVLPGDADLDAMPEIPEVKNLTIRPLGMGAQRRYGQGRRMELVVPYVISSYEAGNYVIPSIKLDFNGEERRTPPIEFKVIDDMSLKWYKTTLAGREVRYSAAFHAIKGTPFVGEKQPVEIKLYFPTDQQVEDWGIPEFERDGVSTWRFQPQPRLGRASLLSRNYFAVSYPSTMSTNRDGVATLGPATVRLQTVQRSPENFGRAVYQPVTVEIPAIQLDSKPLPPNAPEGFENAIGQFEIAVNTGETNVREGDPISLTLTVTGVGNLDTIKPPAPLDSEGWKLYDASSTERGEERREMWGQVEFKQFMRPLRLQQSVPPFRLVYFDPEKAAYETILSESIPLTVMPSTAAGMTTAPQAMAVPVEEMTDILGIVNPADGLIGKRGALPPWSWQLIPALLVFGLFAHIARQRLAPRMKKDPDAVARRREWREVERAPEQIGPFYRSVGHFVERWLGDRKEPVIAEVLSKRDEACFRQDTADMKLDRSERQRVLGEIRRIALPLVAFFLTLSTMVGNAQEDPAKLFSEGRYSEASKAWLDSGPFDQLSADTLFNIGNAAYRMGSPGEAALYYRRALDRDSSHPEARQNLRFLERKFGSVTIPRPDYQHLISRLPLSFWKNVVWASLWMIAIGILIFPATKPGAGIRMASIVAFVTAPLIAAAGALGWFYFPDDARFAPAKEQVVVVADSATVRTDAARTAPKVIDAPAGSLCRLITTSGGWAYVAFTNDSRGWVPLVDIERLVPETKPTPPKLRPVQGSEGNA